VFKYATLGGELTVINNLTNMITRGLGQSLRETEQILKDEISTGLIDCHLTEHTSAAFL
jgi:hypothetical protein